MLRLSDQASLRGTRSRRSINNEMTASGTRTGRPTMSAVRPLMGVNQTWSEGADFAAFDPEADLGRGLPMSAHKLKRSDDRPRYSTIQ
jgi:hypothetical protein